MDSFQGKILVIRGGAIGDFILTLPAIAALRRQFPRAWLEVLGYPHIVQLAVAGGLVDRAQFIEARPLAAFFARHGELAEDLGDYFSEFDLIVSYLYDPDEIFQTNVGRCTPAPFIAGPHRPDEKAGLHASKVYLQPLERLAIFDADPVPRLTLQHHEATLSYLALMPGSGSPEKNWPESNWADFLARLIDETGFDLLLVGAEAEAERLQRLGAALPPARFRLAQGLPLAELGSLLQGCAAFIGHDSGISHLAAALGLPGIVLWADTVVEIWRPPSPKVAVLGHPGGLNCLSADEVLPRLREMASPPKPC
ncbi:MAG TPA: glycosyltransferase family 9 protein [Dongiaceae bacterium]|nr:glycosyltransferase family 9 protein [Dongiaceae bacterium]